MSLCHLFAYLHHHHHQASVQSGGGEVSTKDILLSLQECAYSSELVCSRRRRHRLCHRRRRRRLPRLQSCLTQTVTEEAPRPFLLPDVCTDCLSYTHTHTTLRACDRVTARTE